jgi:hypothetical protein
MNGALFSAVYTYLMHNGPSWLTNARVEQGVKFIAPVLMLVLEWRLVDVLGDLVASNPRQDAPPRPSDTGPRSVGGTQSWKKSRQN